MNLIALARALIKPFVSEYYVFDVYSFRNDPDIGSEIAKAELLPDNYRIGLVVDVSEIKQSPDMLIRKSASSINTESVCFGIWFEDQLAAVCWLWKGEHYRKARNFLPLLEDEAELTYLAVAQQHRGQALAAKLIHYACENSRNFGINQLFARIWHSNTASIRSFHNAGWTRHSRVIDIKFRSLKKACRYVYRF